MIFFAKTMNSLMMLLLSLISDISVFDESVFELFVNRKNVFLNESK